MSNPTAFQPGDRVRWVDYHGKTHTGPIEWINDRHAGINDDDHDYVAVVRCSWLDVCNLNRPEPTDPLGQARKMAEGLADGMARAGERLNGELKRFQLGAERLERERDDLREAATEDAANAYLVKQENEDWEQAHADALDRAEQAEKSAADRLEQIGKLIRRVETEATRRRNANARADTYREQLRLIDCGHGYRLTDSCPCCDVAEADEPRSTVPVLICGVDHAGFGRCLRAGRHTGDHENEEFVWGDDE